MVFPKLGDEKVASKPKPRIPGVLRRYIRAQSTQGTYNDSPEFGVVPNLEQPHPMAAKHKNHGPKQGYPGIDLKETEQDKDPHSSKKEQEDAPVDELVRQLGYAFQIGETIGK